MQPTVGTVVRTGEDEDPIGVMTVLNTQQHKQQPFMGQIKQYVLGKCKDAAVKEKLSKVRCTAHQGQHRLCVYIKMIQGRSLLLCSSKHAVGVTVQQLPVIGGGTHPWQLTLLCRWPQASIGAHDSRVQNTGPVFTVGLVTAMAMQQQ